MFSLTTLSEKKKTFDIIVVWIRSKKFCLSVQRLVETTRYQKINSRN